MYHFNLNIYQSIESRKVESLSCQKFHKEMISNSNSYTTSLLEIGKVCANHSDMQASLITLFAQYVHQDSKT